MPKSGSQNKSKTQIDLAIEMALAAHGNQRYGEVPYKKHLEHVQDVLKRFGFSNEEDLVIACWLHDTLEDTDLKYEAVQKIFGEGVADTVFRVTDEPGCDRTERKTKTYPKIRGHRAATIVKLCDRVANVEASKSAPKHFEKYKKEHPSFQKGIYVKGTADNLWTYLDGLFGNA